MKLITNLAELLRLHDPISLWSDDISTSPCRPVASFDELIGYAGSGMKAISALLCMVSQSH